MNFDGYFKQNNIKKTCARVNILKLLVNADNAVSVESIYEECLKKGVKIDLSTVYRTLELFTSKKIVEKYDFGDGKYSYALRKSDHKHVLECSLCHKEVEIDCPMQQIVETIKNQTGFTLIEPEIQIKIKGVCEECRGKCED